MSTLSKTAALAAARSAVSSPVGRATDWRVYGPYDADKLTGPSTEHHYSDYWRARAGRAQWVAQIALCLMGKGDAAGYIGDYLPGDGGAAEHLLADALRRDAR